MLAETHDPGESLVIELPTGELIEMVLHP